MNHTIQRPGTARFFEWIGRYVRPIVAVTVLVALALGGLFAVVADTDEPQFDPEGEIYTMQERAEATLVSESTIGSATFLVEAFDGGDVLTAAAFQEWKVASDRVRSNHDGRLVDRFDPDLGSPIPGVTSVVDLVDKVLPHGLSEATDKDVKMALAAIFADGVQNADFRFTLSEQAKAITDPDGTVVWTSPAFATLIVYNEAGFDDEAAAELWLRSVQADFRESASVTNSIGVAIDIETTFEEAALSAAPFIFLAVSLIVMLIALVHRSYWSSALVASGLGLTMLSYNGIAALVGLKMGIDADFVHRSDCTHQLRRGLLHPWHRSSARDAGRRPRSPFGLPGGHDCSVHRDAACGVDVRCSVPRQCALRDRSHFRVRSRRSDRFDRGVRGARNDRTAGAPRCRADCGTQQGRRQVALGVSGDDAAIGDRFRSGRDHGGDPASNRHRSGRGNAGHRRVHTRSVDAGAQSPRRRLRTPGRRDDPWLGPRIDGGRHRRSGCRQMAEDRSCPPATSSGCSWR